MQLLMEMRRDLQPDEILALFEYNPWHPMSGLSSPDVSSIAMQCFSANQMRVRCYLRQARIASIRLT